MKGWIGLIGGFILGFLSAVIVNGVAPELLTPYTRGLIPAERMVTVTGTVEKKQREATRLLLTLSTPNGVLLATFSKQIEELDLLIAEGYTVTIRLAGYSPFVENPKVERVEATADRTHAESPAPSMPEGAKP
jgi:hypothetical protein